MPITKPDLRMVPSGGAVASGIGSAERPLLDGNTRLIAHLGHPTASFKAPLIYNPYFLDIGLNAAVVPMGVTAGDFAAALPLIFRMTNLHGALITMPHKIAVVAMLDEISTAVKISGSCNAVLRRPDGSLVGDMFDGEGFVRGLRRKGCRLSGASAHVVGAGGVGSAIAASLAAAGIGRISLFDRDIGAMEALAERLASHYPTLRIATNANDPGGYDIIVNATPLGMRRGDPLPVDPERIDPGAFVGEVVLKEEMTPLLSAARARGCRVQIGVDMLFEMIPAYLEFFGFPTTTPERLRALARISY
jgi:shikimate dehydrogenase